MIVVHAGDFVAIAYWRTADTRGATANGAGREVCGTCAFAAENPVAAILHAMVVNVGYRLVARFRFDDL